MLKSAGLQLEGEIRSDDLHRNIYATDASVYRKLPLAVAYPRTKEDIKKLIAYASENNLSLIPRTAGTSLAGQCVGEGIVVDVSRYFTRIFHVDKEKKTADVEPGVIRDELNEYLHLYDLFFGPNTSTSNRCMIGGMVGNNSSGTTSIQYGVTRDKVLEIEAVLADGSEVVFKSLSEKEFKEKLELNTLEGNIYRSLYDKLMPEEVRERIRSAYPKPEIHRRNNGYAIDEIIKQKPFEQDGENLNLCKLICGSEGTLVFITRIKLQLEDLPPKYSVMVAAHFESVENCLNAVVPVMQHNLFTCEMMDKIILDCTKNNKSQMANRFFIEGDPQAILMLELRSDDEKILEARKNRLVEALAESGQSYAYPALYGDDIQKALELRKAGLGLLGNIVGDKKAVACIEDTAVALDDLALYIAEFSTLMKKYHQRAVYYAHAGAGELHLRPILNLKTSGDVAMFRRITTDVAQLVKKYNGSLSGEHGDGIVRSEFIKLMLGAENYQLLTEIKSAFDPENIFNPGKIVYAPPMDESLRYEKDRKEPEIRTFLDFSGSEGILRATEQCNGSGDCRKTHLSAGAMCPSYHATKDEKDTTRARANTLREFLTRSEKENRFDHQEIKEVLDLCLSCKACSSECPSNMDMATLKAEFLYQYQKENGTSLRDKAFAYNAQLNSLASVFPWLVNELYRNNITAGMLKKVIGISPERNLPLLKPFKRPVLKSGITSDNIKVKGEVVLFIDEFTNYLDGNIGEDAVNLLQGLGYGIHIYRGDSGRTFISKGFLKQAAKAADRNIEKLREMVSGNCPLIGLEPSAVLSFRDEYMKLATDKEEAGRIAGNSFLIEEFLAGEIQKGNITAAQFTDDSRQVKIHNHCHQKALSNQKVTFDILNLPANYNVRIISSGCCGMAGSFGYEKEHYEVSMKVGGLRLFPAIQSSEADTIIAANGTSCRHQILDGTGRKAKHPVTILKEALRK
ncbi:FAD-binding oxidoreductase [Sinomicrobium pectinilyticum]|uniref:FAD-binding oxidoreductase n=1 Tax=Sinomicrobium pectinilyticum TaxID=1084421 RepID=A0A3N0EUJ5_SINP1|nr:FAD-binding and (Fe-S)-binding domain-containing protein [Sinomicrobium pectinilyticum]RNL91417.1 FAD-binding oxidoreductase [Sinomicrobium pectinilyticum]